MNDDERIITHISNLRPVKRAADVMDIFYKIQKEIPESETTRHLYIIRLKSELLTVGRYEILKAIVAENVGVQIHYPPVYYHPYYQSLGYKKGLCPIGEQLYDEIITIPLYFSLTDEDVENVIEAVIKVVNYFFFFLGN